MFYKYKLFGISESWLSNSILSADSEISGYHSTIRLDTSRHQIGVLVYVSVDLPAKRRLDFEQLGSDVICIELQIFGKKCLICNCYRSLGCDIIEFDNIVVMTSDEIHDLVVLGDMNARNKSFWEGDVTNTDGCALDALL